MALTAQDFLNYQKQVDPGSQAYGQLGALAQNPNALSPAMIQNLITQINPSDPNGLSSTVQNQLSSATRGTFNAPTGTAAPTLNSPTLNPQDVTGGDPTGGNPSNGSTAGGITGSGGIGSILNQIFGGQNFNLASVLPAILGIGGGIWQWLGSDKAFNNAGNLVAGAEQGAGNEVMQAANNAQGAVNNAASSAASGVDTATGNANSLLGSLYQNSTGQLSPYTTAGAVGANGLAAGLEPGGNLNSNLTADQVLQNDPGYQFRLDQGLRQIQGLNAARGLSGSGNEDKELENYAQDYASNEFGNAFQRQQQSQNSLFSRLAGTAGIGQTGIGQGITSGEAFGSPQANNLLSSAIYGGNAAQNAGFNSGAFGLQGAQYQGNAGVTGAGAQAGAIIDANQQKNAMIQQLVTSLLSLFKGGSTSIGGTSGTQSNPIGSILSAFGI